MTRLLIFFVVCCTLVSCKNDHRELSINEAIKGTWVVDSFENNAEKYQKVEDLLLATVDFSGVIFKFDDDYVYIYSDTMDLEEKETLEYLEDDTLLVGNNRTSVQIDGNLLVLRFNEGTYFLTKVKSSD